MKELVVKAKIENLEQVQDFVRAQLGECPPKILTQLIISVDEIFSNIASYAYEREVGDVTVRVAVGDDITLTFEDGGMAYDPLAQADPDTTLALEDREIGGLGIFMVKNLMDAVEYRRVGSKNVLTVKKNVP